MSSLSLLRPLSVGHAICWIEHFFTHYKDLEKKKWVRIGKWGDAEEARRITLEAIERYEQAKDQGDEPHVQDDVAGREG